MNDKYLIDLITQSISFTGKEKTELIKNMPIFSAEDKVFLINIIEREQDTLNKALKVHFWQEEKIIVQYIKKVLKLYDTEQLVHIKDRIKALLSEENRETDIAAAEKLLKSL